MADMHVSDRQAPNMIRYSQMTPLAFEAVQKLKKFYPTNQATYSGVGNNVIRIPISSGDSFLDGSNSYLQCSFTNSNATAGCNYTFSNSHHSLIDRLRIVSSSGQELEYILQYNHLHCALSDLLLSPEKRMTRLQEGYSQNTMGGTVLTSSVAMASADNAVANVIAGVNASLAGLRATNTVDATTIGCYEMVVAKDATVQVYIPLELSQLVGANKKLLPLFLTGELTLEITLAQHPCLVTSVTTPDTYVLSNVAYNASMISFGGQVNQALTQMVASSGLFLHATCWSNQVVSLAANQSSFVNSERLKSVKSALITFSDPAWAVNVRNTNRVHNGLQSLQLKIGSEYFPVQPLRADSTAAASCGLYLNEAYHALGAYNSIDHSSVTNIYNFAANAQAVNKVGRAVYGIELDAFNREQVESGISTVINNPITILMEGSTGNNNAYTFLLYDAVFQITNQGSFIVVK